MSTDKFVSASLSRAAMLRLFGAVLLIFVSYSAFPQDIKGEPLYGTANLIVGFTPDPFIVNVTPGGSDTVAQLGDECVGFVNGDNPDYILNYEAGRSKLGFFVDANVDTTLVINSPNGAWYCNDDSASLTSSNPGLLIEKPLSGKYTIWIGTYASVSSYESAKLVITELDESGWVDMELNSSSIVTNNLADSAGNLIDFGDDSSLWSEDGECDDPRFEGVGSASQPNDSYRYHDATDCRELYALNQISLVSDSVSIINNGDRQERGSLGIGDEVLPDESFADRYNFTANSGDSAVVDLRSGEFDTFLIVFGPDGERFENDDFDASVDRSLITIPNTQAGNYEVVVTSYEGGEIGGYTLDIDTGIAALDEAPRVIAGDLGSEDESFSSGEYFDTYTFDGLPGQNVTIDLVSDEFDTYLVLTKPNGEHIANDDAQSSSHSLIETELSESGTYRVRVTSYASGESGHYSLSINQTDANNALFQNRDVLALQVGESAAGVLAEGDSRFENGSFQDSYVFNGTAGETVVIDMRSSAFDTYLSMVTPAGEAIENDDFEGNTEHSQLEVTLQETGRYRVLARSYSQTATGPYNLLMSISSASSVTTPTLVSGNRIHGIFVGVADYPGTDNDLDRTDQDAERARDALIEGAGMNPQNAYTLLNSNATRANLDQAIADISASITNEDTLVIFYSGHGNRIPRSGGPDSRDPDGMDETIELYDSTLIDDELARILDTLNVGTVLLVMDSCFSGGFAKDIVSAPGRMGLFSSEEDTTSLVAFKFQAGGYLSVFFDEAIRGRNADSDNNSELTALELSQYLHDRYRSDVKSIGGDDFVRTSGPTSSYQHLVVDRGGVGPYNVLFRHE